MATVSKHPRTDPPNIAEMSHLIETAAGCVQSSSYEGRGNAPMPTFHPNGALPRNVFADLLKRLGYEVVTLQPVDHIFDAIRRDASASGRIPTKTHPSDHPKPAAAEDGIFLRVLYDWLPTIAALDRHVEGVKPTTSMVSDVDLMVLKKKLPTEKTPEAQQARLALFRGFDPNGNGFLSLAEIDKAARDVLQLNLIFDCKPVLMRAFQAARKAEPPSDRNHGGDYVTRRTFRILLWYLKQYFNLWQLFNRVDESGDRRISLEEFQNALPELRRIGLVSEEEVQNGRATFQTVDTDRGGMLLFEEFAAWALARGLVLEECDDDDDDRQ